MFDSKHTSVRPVLLLALLFSLTSLACGGGGSAYTQTPATGSGPATLALNNVSNEAVYQVYMSPSADNYWGNELLAGRVLQVGQSFTISGIAPGYWDVRVVDASGNYKEWYREYLGPGGEYWVDVSNEGWTR